MAGMLPGVGVGPRRRSLPSRQEDQPGGSWQYTIREHREPLPSNSSAMDEAALMARLRLERKLGDHYSSPRDGKDHRQQSRDGGKRKGSRMLLGRTWNSVFKRLHKSDRKVCAVCLDDVQGGGERRVMDLSCSHKYHSECLLPWIADHPHCPCCRTRSDSDESLQSQVRLIG